MRKFGMILIVVLTLGALAPANAQSPISVEASVDALSGYLWRGGVLGADDKIVSCPMNKFKDSLDLLEDRICRRGPHERS